MNKTLNYVIGATIVAAAVGIGAKARKAREVESDGKIMDEVNDLGTDAIYEDIHQTIDKLEEEA